MKSLLLIEDGLQNLFPRVADIFSYPEYRCDRFLFGARAVATNYQDSAATIVKKIKSGQYDAIVLGNTPVYWNIRKGLFRNLGRILKRWPETRTLLEFEKIIRAIKEDRNKTPLYLFDVMDCPVIDNARFRYLTACSAYFKRELPSNIVNAFLYVSDKTESPDNIMRSALFPSLAQKLRPISIGISDEKFATLSSLRSEKKFDLFFSGAIAKRPIREIGRDALMKLKGDGFRVHISDEHYPLDVFYEFCSQSLICWSPEGFGSDCFRHYEIAACGSVPLRRHSSLFQYAPFRDNQECLYYLQETSNIYEVARNALAHPDRLEMMGKQAQSLVGEFHRYSRLAEYILSHPGRDSAPGTYRGPAMGSIENPV